MNNGDFISLGGVPAFGRMDEYFGLAAMEPVRFGQMVQHVRSMAASGSLAAHVAAELARRSSMSREDRAEERKNRRIYEVRRMSAAGSGAASGAGGSGGDDSPVCAIIHLDGTLMKQVGSLDDGTSTAFARAQIRAASADDDVGAILLVIDSPGGYVAGTEDLAADIRTAAANMPVMAYVEDLCASAAYWCACACSAIYANNGTAEIGSIGVFMGFYEATGMAGQMGLKPVVIKSGDLKATGFPGTEIDSQQRDYLQGLVDSTHGQFLSVVAQGRGMSLDQADKLATGQVYPAKAAMQNGLIDGIKSMDEVLGMLGAKAPMSTKGKTRSAERGTRGKVLTSAASAPSVRNKESMAVDALSAASTTVGGNDPDTEGGPVMGDPTTKAASLKELKTALPKSSAEFREKCQEDGLTLEQSAIRHAQESTDALEQERALAKIDGVKPILSKVNLGNAEQLAKGAKRQLAQLASQIAKDQSIPRHEAFVRACKENPELHRAMVVNHNLKNGRKRQAAEFAENFEMPEPEDDD